MSALIVFSGRPGVGKTTLAARVAAKIGTVHVRVASIEIAILGLVLQPAKIGEAGYAVAAAIGGDSQRYVDCIADDPNAPTPWSPEDSGIGGKLEVIP